MDYGLTGNMRVNVAEPQLQIDSTIEATRKADIDDSQISMLELEIEDLSLELEEEKKKSSIERAECEKHLQELEDAEQELLRCRTALQKSEKRLVEAQVEIRDKNEELADAEEELMQCRQRVGELEQRIEQTAEQNRERVQSYDLKADEAASELAKSQEQCAQHDSMGQQETTALNQMNDVLQGSLEEQTRLTIQVKTLEDQMKTLRRELQTAQNEVANKTKELDVLRSYLRGSGQAKSKKEREVRETETEIEKNLRMKDSMISRYTHQIEELQVKAKRIPQLASRLSKLESSYATLKSQWATQTEDMKTNTKAFEQKENKTRDHISKLESALLSSEAKTIAMQSQFEKEISEAIASKDALENEKDKTAKRAAKLESENATLKRDIKESKDTQRALKEEKNKLEERVSHLEKVRAEQRALLGIVFSVDISGSLCGNPERLAKEVFRKLINDLCSKSPKAHVGVVVHASRIYIARQMAEVDSDTSSVLDSIACSGSEDYSQAFIYVISLLSTFKASYPKAKQRVIMISDGQECSTLGDVSTLSADGVPCHNIVIYNGSSGLNSTATERYSSWTGGRNFKYNGSYGLSGIDVLIEP